MNVVCLDMEGVLVPEIWIAFAEASGIPELKRTTRDEPDYDKLMKWRLNILKEHGLGLKEIQATIEKIVELENLEASQEEIGETVAVICRRNGMTVEELKPHYDAQFEQAVIKSILTGKAMDLIRDAAEITVV